MVRIFEAVIYQLTENNNSMVTVKTKFEFMSYLWCENEAIMYQLTENNNSMVTVKTTVTTEGNP